MSYANSGPPLAGGCGPRSSANCINSRASAHPAAGTISDKGRSRRRSVKNRRTFSISRVQSRTCSSYAEARKRLRSELLIASKVPKASDLAQSQDRPRNRFTAAAFRLPFGRAKGNIIIKGIATLRVAQFAAAPPRRTATRPKARTALRRRRTAGPRTRNLRRKSQKIPRKHGK